MTEPLSETPPPEPRFSPVALLLAVAVGAAGGALFAYLRLPLPWMLGAMSATTVAALMGLRMQMPRRLRMPMSAVIGVMLGAAFTPDLVDRIATWSVTLAGLLVYAVVAGGLVMTYLRLVAGYDARTAYFSSSPGGLGEMTLIAGEMGADERIVGLSHALRILLVVMALPFLFQIFGEYEPIDQMLPPGSSMDMPLEDWALLIACAVGGALVAKPLRIPAPFLVGPVVFSGAVHMLGVTDSAPPGFLVAVAQVVIGSSVGCRFVNTAVEEVLRTLLVACGSTVILLGTAVVFGLALQLMVDVEWPVLLLAYAPGGLAEMSLVALGIGSDVAFVATHHIIRIAIVIILGPTAFRLFQRSLPPPDKTEPRP